MYDVVEGFYYSAVSCCVAAVICLVFDDLAAFMSSGLTGVSLLAAGVVLMAYNRD